MPDLEPSNYIYIAKSTIAQGGRGVFTKQTITTGSCIEKCPVINLAPRDRKHLRKTGLVNYYFLWRDADKVNVSLCFGYGSIYNHSFQPNAQYQHNSKEDCMDFYALRDIKAGEEIFVNYNGDPADQQPLRLPGMYESEVYNPPFHKRVLNGISRRLKILWSWFSN